MNRTIVRTSLFWLALFAVVAAVYVYRTRSIIHPPAVPTGVQPIASGPMPDMNKDADKDASMPAAKMEAPLVPVQLTNEQMNSIGVKTGTVEYKQLSDEIRATGTVDVDERLQSSSPGAVFWLHPQGLCRRNVSICPQGRAALHDL